MTNYDVIIIGGGPAGLTAGLYAARGGLNTLLLESGFPGGQIVNTLHVDNYPGLMNVEGADLALRIQRQAEEFGLVIRTQHIKALDLGAREKRVLGEQDTLAATALILSMGASPRSLDLEGERRLRGRGVSYCATCDGAFFKGKRVAVVGGGDTAVEDALFLSTLCEHVYIIHRRDALRAVESLQRSARAVKNIEIVWDSVLADINGEARVEGIQVQNVHSRQITDLAVSGVFIAVGAVPNSGLVKDMVALDAEGYILTDERMRTGIEGVFAAGDIRQKPLRQIVTAAADGAIAATEAQRYIFESKT